MEVSASGAPAVAIRARELGLSWPGGARALADVSFEVAAGEKVALLGANGAGKSTLLRLLAGRLEPSSGRLELFGAPPAAARARVGYLPQELTLDPEMTARETLNLIAALLGLPERPARVAAAARLFALDPHLGKPVAELSGGWKRRLDLALFLLEDKPLLLLDEPGSGLDAEGEEILFTELAARAAGGTAIVVAGHDWERLSTFTTRALLFEAGRQVAEGRPDQLRPRPGGATVAPVPVPAPGSGRGGGRGAGGGGGRFS